MAICWHCKLSEYHDYKDKHGIRCPRCGQLEKNDPNQVIIRSEPVKAATNRRSK